MKLLKVSNPLLKQSDKSSRAVVFSRLAYILGVFTGLVIALGIGG